MVLGQHPLFLSQIQPRGGAGLEGAKKKIFGKREMFCKNIKKSNIKLINSTLNCRIPSATIYRFTAVLCAFKMRELAKAVGG
jgi:hypothetical protein